MRNADAITAVLLVGFLLLSILACGCAWAADEPPEDLEEPVREEAPKVVAVYDVPLSAELQAYIIRESQEHCIDPAVIFAMIDVESKFDEDIVGDAGAAFGLMQIQPRWHYERMQRLGCTKLFDPYQNVTVGIDYLAELLSDKYYSGNLEKALTAYNAGPVGAQNMYFQYGISGSEYCVKVLTIAQTLSEGVRTDVYS